MPSESTIAEIMEILRGIDPLKRPIHPATSIFTELDFDSLRMLDFIESLKEKYDVDFFLPPRSLADLRTPATVAAAVTLARAANGAPAGDAQNP